MFISKKDIHELMEGNFVFYKVNESNLKVRTAHTIYTYILTNYNSKLFVLNKQSFISFNYKDIDPLLSDLLHDLSIVNISKDELTKSYLNIPIVNKKENHPLGM